MKITNKQLPGDQKENHIIPLFPQIDNQVVVFHEPMHDLSYPT